jgi:hypothetical protein
LRGLEGRLPVGAREKDLTTRTDGTSQPFLIPGNILLGKGSKEALFVYKVSRGVLWVCRAWWVDGHGQGKDKEA